MSSCQSCGSAIAGDSRFCQTCGSPTEVRAAVSMPAAEGSATARCYVPVRRDWIENDGYKRSGSSHLCRRLRHGDCVSCAGSLQGEFLCSLSRFPVDLLQCRMDRLLDCLDDSLGGAHTFDGWSLRLNCFAVDVDFHSCGLWNLDLPDAIRPTSRNCSSCRSSVNSPPSMRASFCDMRFRLARGRGKK